jgi:hypothetical protein
MDIHKPKPWRGLREFLKEIGTIVIGVLIALGAEQGVSGLHDRQLSREAREAVRGELDLDLASAHQRLPWQPCIDARLAFVEQAINAPDLGQPYRTIAYIGRPTMPTIYEQRWAAATAGGRTSLLSSDEQRDFARVYLQLTLVKGDEHDEIEAWARIRALEGVSHPSAETLARAREALSEARTADYNVRRSVRGAEIYAAPLGIKGDAALASIDKKRIASICLPTTTRREDVQRLSHDAVGAP